MAETLWILVLIAVLLVILYKVSPVKRVIVFEYQRGLKYRKGRFVETLQPGAHWKLFGSTSIVPVDIRPEFVTIPGQDVLSADGVTVKVSLAAEYQVNDANVAINKNSNFRTSLYLALQVALRQIIDAQKIEALIENRATIGAKLLETASAKVSTYGVKLISADVKDIMLVGELRSAFAQVLKAQKDGQAKLERARGETAALRSLANAAKMIEDNPNLLQLRALQSLSESSGNTLVFGVSNQDVPRPKGNKPGPPPSAESPLPTD